jgi:hypothetical protein
VAVRQPNSSGIGEGERDRLQAGDRGGYAGGGRLAVFLVGRLPAVDDGVLLLIRDGQPRRGYALAKGSHRWRLHRSRARAVIFMSWIREGAGHELRVISARLGLAHACFASRCRGPHSCSVPRWPGTRGRERRCDRTRRGARRSLPRRAPRSSCRSERPPNRATSIGRRCAGFTEKSNRFSGFMSGPPSGLRAPVRSLVLAGGR